MPSLLKLWEVMAKSKGFFCFVLFSVNGLSIRREGRSLLKLLKREGELIWVMTVTAVSFSLTPEVSGFLNPHFSVAFALRKKVQECIRQI